MKRVGSVASVDNDAHSSASNDGMTRRPNQRPESSDKGHGDANRPHHRLLGERDAAAYLGLSYWTVRELRVSGRIAYVPIGHRIYYDIYDLDEFVLSAKAVRTTS